MMRWVRLGLFGVALFAVGLWAQEAAAPASGASQRVVPQVFRLEIDATERGQPSWIILVQSDGTGLYWPTLTSKFGEVHLRVSEGTWKRVQAGAAAVQQGRCETKLKNVAKTGVKDVEYHAGTTPDTHSDCTFNYSDDADLNGAVAVLQAVVETMQIGEKLKHEHRFDHLGLDAELDSLTDAVKDGNAIELQNIAPILQAIVEDDELMAPSRRKAKNLLEMPGVQAAVSAR